MPFRPAATPRAECRAWPLRYRYTAPLQIRVYELNELPSHTWSHCGLCPDHNKVSILFDNGADEVWIRIRCLFRSLTPGLIRKTVSQPCASRRLRR
jgi:hypothetical protein